MSNLAIKRWEGAGLATLCLSHANGFSKEVWGPVVDELRLLGETLPAVAWDFPSHGESPKAPHPIDWWSFGSAAAGVSLGEPAPRIGVGHSMGSAALVMAQLENPGLFERLVLVEPIVFPGPYRRSTDENMMARSARRRRRSFSSPQEALLKFQQKQVFSRWTPEAMDAYIAGGLERDGDRWILACSPEDEAELYETAGAHGVYDRLGEVEIPVLVVAGEDSTSHTPEYTAHLAGRLPDGKGLVVAGTTHFVPMEAPRLLAEIIQAEIRSLGR